jgi:hypothetical protein
MVHVTSARPGPRQWVLVSLLPILLTACGPTQPSPPPVAGSPDLILVHQTGIFSVYAVESDRQPAGDVAQALHAHASRIAYVCQHQFPFEQIPTFAEMEQAYASVPAADLFAYAIVDFIANEYDGATLNRLLRSPDSLESVLGLTREGFEHD